MAGKISTIGTIQKKFGGYFKPPKDIDTSICPTYSYINTLKTGGINWLTIDSSFPNESNRCVPLDNVVMSNRTTTIEVIIYNEDSSQTKIGGLELWAGNTWIDTIGEKTISGGGSVKTYFTVKGVVDINCDLRIKFKKGGGWTVRWYYHDEYKYPGYGNWHSVNGGSWSDGTQDYFFSGYKYVDFATNAPRLGSMQILVDG